MTDVTPLRQADSNHPHRFDLKSSVRITKMWVANTETGWLDHSSIRKFIPQFLESVDPPIDEPEIALI
jgi:hypothetical protein